MIIELFGGLRQKADCEAKLASGSPNREALDNLCSENAALQAAIFAGDELRPHIRVMVNGRDIELALGLESTVTDDDMIAIFPPIAGGQAKDDIGIASGLQIVFLLSFCRETRF